MQALSRERALFLELVAERIVPELAGRGAGGMAGFVGIVDGALMDGRPELRRQFGTLLGCIRWLPRLRWGTSFERLSVSSAHPMGRCRMGGDPASSVTDGWGRVDGVSWLYLADASLFPACSKVNPFLTVMALAGRVAEAVRNDHGEVGAA